MSVLFKCLCSFQNTLLPIERKLREQAEFPSLVKPNLVFPLILTVLVQTAIIECHRLSGLNNRKLLSHSSEAKSLRSRYQHGWILVKLLAYRWSSSHCVLIGPPHFGCRCKDRVGESQHSLIWAPVCGHTPLWPCEGPSWPHQITSQCPPSKYDYIRS